MSKAKWLFLFLVAISVAIPSYAVELSLGGFPSFMRTRYRFISDGTFVSALDDTDAAALGFNDNSDNISFVDTRLRLTPQLVLSDAVTIRAQVDVADNMIWGGLTSGFANDRRTLVNSSLTPNDRFRGALLTNVGFGTVVSTFGEATATDEEQFFNVRMLHVDIVLPANLGFVRIGRQPFDWGLGILANGGWDPMSDLGFILDRFLYLKSWPLGGGTFTFVLVSDRLTQGATLTTAAGDGYDIAAVALIYNTPAFGGNLTLGVYDFPYIHQEDVLSTAPIQAGGVITPGVITGIDLRYLNLYSGLIDWKSDVFRLVGEIQGAFGKVEGLLANGDDSDISNQIIFAVRAEYYPGFPVKNVAAEFGWADGDDTSNGVEDFEGNVIHFNPAYNIDNLLFKHMIPNVYRLESSVANAFYARAWTTVKLLDKLSFTPQVLVAWNEETSSPLISGQDVDRYLGTEVEGTFTFHVHPGVTLDLIGSLVIAGSGLQDLVEQQAGATFALADLDGDGDADGSAPPGGVDAEKYPFALQARLLVYIDQFFK